MILPPGNDPDMYNWTIARGMGLLLIDPGPNPDIGKIDLLSAALLRDGADGALALRTGGIKYLPPTAAAA